MAYTDIDKPSDYFNTKLFSGNGSGGHAITGVGFAPNWVWLKKRDGTPNHHLYDTIRGAVKMITTVDDRTESDQVNGLTAFGSDGFTVGSDADINSGSMVSWNWKAGTSVSGDTTGSGTAKTYTGSVNTTSGFSIIKYTGNGTSGHTIPHHLTVAPNVIITKVLNDTSSPYVYHSGIGATKNLFLSETDAAGTSAAYWANTAPSSSVFTVGDQTGNNGNSKNIIAYCFADIKGYSKFGSYTGNGNADGPMIVTGMKPAWLMIKRSSTGGDDWMMTDNKMNLFNVINKRLNPNSNGAEQSTDIIDFVSNGFKLRATPDYMNGSGSTYIYMAFAENPFVTSTGVPATAR